MDEMKGHKLSFAGQIISAEHLTSQQGKAYGRFKIEDHNASIELSMFSEGYLKVKHLLNPGTFVLVHASPQPSYRDKEKTELKILDVQLLDTVVDQSSKQITMHL
ncbi:OB-fold nucleic acid binding domain-containing protein, partial [Arthrospira platensis SPKY1]|nr:OB-fold nucleic acid binding domain-containing protein [Arthrospira platensis SPKY1]